MKSFTQRWREASDEAKDQPMEDTPTDPKGAHCKYCDGTGSVEKSPCVSEVCPICRGATTEPPQPPDILPELSKNYTDCLSYCGRLKAELNTEREARIQAQKEFDDLRVWLDGEDRYPVSGPAKFIAEKHRAALAAQTERADRAIKQLEECTYSHQQTNARFEEACERADRLQAEVEESAYRFMNERNSLTAELDAVRKELEHEKRRVVGMRQTGEEMQLDLDAAQAKCAELEKLIQDALLELKQWHETGHWNCIKRATALLTPAPPEEKRP